MKARERTNASIAKALEELAARLAERGANRHRVDAYHRAADTVRHTTRSLAAMVREDGPEALKTLPDIGESLASRIAGYVETGELRLLEEIKNDFVPERVFGRVPGIGKELARRIHDELGIETLEELEIAAHDGRLERIEGFGPGRLQALRNQLSTILSRQSHRRARRFRSSDRAPAARPSVRMLLRVDRAYRQKSERGELPTIIPRRFNPEGEAWLPILESRQGPWWITALFSNTARAHRLGKTNDWVVIYCEHKTGGPERQYTVVTETRGDLKGQRVVRGREAECRALYRRHQSAAERA